MIRVVDKKVVKHLIDTRQGLLSVPIRVHFEFALESQRFVGGSMERRYLFNREALLKRVPGMDAERLDREVEEVVDRALLEHVKFNHKATGDVKLYPEPEHAADDDASESTPPELILPPRI